MKWLSFVLPTLQIIMLGGQLYILCKSVYRFKSIHKIEVETDQNLEESRKLLKELIKDSDQPTMH